jgi:hypothetical protein
MRLLLSLLLICVCDSKKYYLDEIDCFEGFDTTANVCDISREPLKVGTLGGNSTSPLYICATTRECLAIDHVDYSEDSIIIVGRERSRKYRYHIWEHSSQGSSRLILIIYRDRLDEELDRAIFFLFSITMTGLVILMFS